MSIPLSCLEHVSVDGPQGPLIVDLTGPSGEVVHNGEVELVAPPGVRAMQLK
jgi:hypothetical protein